MGNDRKVYALGEEGLAGLVEHLGGSRGGGGSDGMEARLAKVESCVEHLQRDVGEIKTAINDARNTHQTDFRILFGALIAVALGLAAIMAKGFGWI